MITAHRVLRTCIAAAALAAGLAQAQGYPNRPITVVVPVTAGSSIDVASRAIANELGKRLGQPTVIDNRAGASGNIGAAFVAKAPPDGYTLLITSSNLGMAPALMKALPWDPQTAFTPVAQLFTGAMSIAVGPHVPVKTLPEFLEYAKKQPAGKLNYATPGNGTPHHFGTYLFTQASGVQMTHVPYKGTGPAIVDLLGGRIEFAYFSLGNLLEHHKLGRLKVLATSTAQRLPQVPDVPTLRELGLKDGEVDAWVGMFAPGGTPASVLDRLKREMPEVMKSAAVRTALEAQSFIPAQPGTAEQLAADYKTDLERWPAVVNRMGMKLE
jgi:tripartite-type tricarboxylate transporter receptor subunit TctC